MLYEPEVVNERGAAEIVGLSPATLNSLRVRGGGPPFIKLGRVVRYRVADLRAFRDARLCQTAANAVRNHATTKSLLAEAVAILAEVLAGKIDRREIENFLARAE